MVGILQLWYHLLFPTNPVEQVLLLASFYIGGDGASGRENYPRPRSNKWQLQDGIQVGLPPEQKALGAGLSAGKLRSLHLGAQNEDAFRQ